MRIHFNRQMRFSSIAIVVIALISSTASAQENRQRVRGIVLSIATDKKSFSVVDRGGTVVPVNVTSNTQYQNGQVRLNDVIKFGMDVRVQLGEDGTAERVFTRGMADQIEFEQLQPFMQCSDQEWAVLRPKIDRVRDLIRQANGDGGDPRENDGSAQGRPQYNNVHALQRTLQATFFDQDATADKLNVNLTSLRQARAKARADLVQARKELTDLLTARQEALLVITGILE